MKKAITVRLDPELLEQVRLKAEDENRTLTNFIATALKDRLRLASNGPRHLENGQK
ncbi:MULTISPECIES: YlcI/YnfO family protein [unclassified Rhizobium]|uniref:YlcI/YnfO family protein n=1 Tax=unclassified Rhizobium TaxID=2613769 RepID=UPI001ADD01BA|nr:MULTISPECIES: YlcI/YnfO family protein [unclassified Rhizobium]MBO9127840.1 ribbon-helix-helix protein, CopG family [Rhizobium sp. 16-488-2b]MBO9175128.1 ribbon-helix-helix protein, CopG family [Rhizobium sp. 16-488-2a]